MRKTSISVSISAAFAQQGSALSQLRAITGADKVGRHDSIVQLVGTIFALALCNMPPKGYGNAADHAKIAAIFTDARMPRYAEACIGTAAALKAKGFRSIPEWDDALQEGFAMADGMLCHLRPKTYTAAELKDREAKRAEKAKQREADAKTEAAAAKVKEAEERAKLESAAYERGRAEATAQPITAAVVVDLIRAGQFTAADLSAIGEAIAAVQTREAIAA